MKRFILYFFLTSLISFAETNETKCIRDVSLDRDEDGRIDHRQVWYSRGPFTFKTFLEASNEGKMEKVMEIIEYQERQILSVAINEDERLVRLFHGHDGVTIQETDYDGDGILETISIRDKKGNFLDSVIRHCDLITKPIPDQEFQAFRKFDRQTRKIENVVELFN